jgi:hypothetical protein
MKSGRSIRLNRPLSSRGIWVNFSILDRFSVERPMCLAPPIKFFKTKKEKKESHSSKWKVSKMQVFLKKYYPNGWRFFQKPAGLGLAFL